MKSLAKRFEQFSADENHPQQENELGGLIDRRLAFRERLKLLYLASPGGVGQPVTFDEGGDDEQGQQMHAQDEAEASARRLNVLPGGRRLENQQQCFDHARRVVSTNRLVDNSNLQSRLRGIHG